jgi:ubiquinone/menaquinone biosynthesis C-methylase UbiE
MKNHNLILQSLLLILFNIINPALFCQNDMSEPWEKQINERQPPEKVMNAIGIRPGMLIGEIGAGRGRYTVYLAGKTGTTGKVLANDIDESSLAYLRGRCKRLGIKNVETIVGEMNDPRLPEHSLDMAIMVLVYHMLDNPDNLLRNIKRSLKPGAPLIIVDPRDRYIDEEFGIDRSKPGEKPPTITARIEKSARESGYTITKLDTLLPGDYIFTLMPKSVIQRKPAGEIIQQTILTKGIEASVKVFSRIKKDSVRYDLSEREFTNLGYEFIGSRSYPEAIAVLNMGAELFPKSSKIHGELGEAYVLTGEKEKARACFKIYLENNPAVTNVKEQMDNFDAIYEAMRPKKE